MYNQETDLLGLLAFKCCTRIPQICVIFDQCPGGGIKAVCRDLPSYDVRKALARMVVCDDLRARAYKHCETDRYEIYVFHVVK